MFQVPLIDWPLRLHPRLDGHLLRHALSCRPVRPRLPAEVHLPERGLLQPHRRLVLFTKEQQFTVRSMQVVKKRFSKNEKERMKGPLPLSCSFYSHKEGIMSGAINNTDKTVTANRRPRIRTLSTWKKTDKEKKLRKFISFSFFFEN